MVWFHFQGACLDTQWQRGPKSHLTNLAELRQDVGVSEVNQKGLFAPCITAFQTNWENIWKQTNVHNAVIGRTQISNHLSPFLFHMRHLGAKTTQSAAWLPSWSHACARFACGLKCHMPTMCSRGPGGVLAYMCWNNSYNHGNQLHSGTSPTFRHGCLSKNPDGA